jgi:hypothetical protein
MYWNLQKIYMTDDIRYVQEFSRSWDLRLLILGFGTGRGQIPTTPLPSHVDPTRLLRRLKAGRPCSESEATGSTHGVS